MSIGVVDADTGDGLFSGSPSAFNPSSYEDQGRLPGRALSVKNLPPLI